MHINIALPPPPIPLLLLQIILLLHPHPTTTAKILAIIPTASYSHQIYFHPLWTALANRHHQITIITTDPLPKPTPNLHQIDVGREIYTLFDDLHFYETISGNPAYFWRIVTLLHQISIRLAEIILDHPQVGELKHQKFDLVIAEAHFPSILGLVGHFRCPWIGVSSMESGIQYNVAIGNPTHPVLYPDYNLPFENEEDLDFLERVLSFLYRLFYVYAIDWYVLPELGAVHASRGWDAVTATSMIETQKDIGMLLVATHPVFHNVRPALPNTVAIGVGMHFKMPEVLPEDIQKFLDQGHRGVIYFSLGSNVNSNILTPEFKRALIDTFAEIPYPVVMKMDADIGTVTENVLVKKWLPQQDILRHGNVKLFITQGGLQSLQESVYNGIPLIGIPFFGDQITNVNKMVKRGYGLKVDKRSLTKQSLKAAIEEVMRNESYREAARTMGEIFRDEEIPSLQRAVFWTEYVIRHKGAKHLRSPAADMPAWKYYMLDVLGFLVVLVAILVWGILWLVRCAIVWSWRKIFGSKTKRTKKNKGID